MAEQRRWYFCQDDSGLLPGGDRLQPWQTTLNALCSPRSNALCFPGTKPPEPERWALLGRNQCPSRTPS